MSEPLQRVLDALESAGLNPRRAGGGYSSRCPAHEDNVPSLSISEGREGRVLMRCHAGCRAEEVVARLGLHLHDLFAVADGLPPLTRWVIKNASGLVVAVHVRR